MRQQLRQDIDLRTFEIDEKTYHAAKIRGFPDYYITTTGHVVSTVGKSNRVLADRDNSGYLHVRLTKNKTTKEYKVHRLAALTFLEPPANDPFGVTRTQVNHIDGRKTNNKICNLEFVSPKENHLHYRKVLLAVLGANSDGK